MKKKNLSLFGASSSLGQKKSGVELAPMWLRQNGLIDLMETSYEVIDHGDFLPSTLSQNLELIQHYEIHTYHLYRNILYALQHDSLCLNIGGDHSIALASLNASLEFNPNTKIIWIDAHADINNFKTTPTGNLHGMPLAFSLGLINEDKNFSWLKKLRPENLIYIGLRDVDPGELDFLDKLNITYFEADQVARDGIVSIIDKISDQFGDDNSDLHISLDVDGLDPKHFPSTGTPVEGGLSLSDVKKVLNQLMEKYHLINFDLVELNPSLGSSNDRLLSLSNALELLKVLAVRHDNNLNYTLIKDDLIYYNHL